ncbi:MAG: EamA family transporter [Desulfosarcina sp.]|nr:EamA family transporter [Desulfobacterales bacterium]
MLEIHCAVFLFGMAGLFGKFLALPPLVIVFGRTLFASICLICIIAYLKKSLALESKRDFIILAALGILLSIHWVTFFYSIQLSTVATGLLTFSTYPFFVAILEPCFFKEKLTFFALFSAILIFAGVALIIPSFTFDNNISKGVFWGVFSGFTFAVLSLLNRKYVQTYSPLIITFFQNSFAALVLFPFLFFKKWELHSGDIFFLMFLGIFCTAIAHALFIRGLKHVKTQFASIVAGLEPVYGIIFALVLFGEVPSLRTLSGGVLIMGTAVLATFRNLHSGSKSYLWKQISK